ncbi:sce7725 family protein [Gilliamella sp. BG7]|uniref:sce7725 family protein n=1 Tax=unclassified Gilliamella TaxID=2685620 RepID=UPI003987A675
MYFPVMRGKRNELIALRELAPLVSDQSFKPIIEPVRNNFSPLIRTIDALNKYKIIPIVIINPCMGDFNDNDLNIINDLKNDSLELDISFTPCVKVTSPAESYKSIIDSINLLQFPEKAVYVYDDIELDKIDLLSDINYVIINRYTPFKVLDQLNNIVLMDDPFQKKNKNADYSHKSFFSDLHMSFESCHSKVIGFGDYTIVGNNYSESGGPAFVVTIHLSYIDEEYDFMYVRHFSSEDDKTPTNPGGKFRQALDKVIQLLNSSQSPFIESNGIQELKILHEGGHFPGLGVIKKISMKHHIETICEYLNR